MPTGVYDRKWYGRPHVHGTRQTAISNRVRFGTSGGAHNCLALAYTNEQRKLEGESPVSMFQDCDNQSWNLRVGVEFIEMKFCPFCGSKLKC